MVSRIEARDAWLKSLRIDASRAKARSIKASLQKKQSEVKKQQKKKKRRKPKKKHNENSAISAFRQLLRSLGFETYAQYLQSDLWKSIRRRVLERDGRECGLCLGEGSVVHHLRYNFGTMKGITLDWLLTLCHGCHNAIEFTGKEKNSLVTANRTLCELGDLPYDKVNQYGMRLDLTLIPISPTVRGGPPSNRRRSAIHKKNKRKRGKSKSGELTRLSSFVGGSREDDEQ